MGQEKQLCAAPMVAEKRQKRGAQSYRRGVWAELFCAFLLMLKGYRIIKKRHKTRVGEIDLIAMKGNAIVFVEVKARPSPELAGQAISEAQKVRLKRAAASYLAGKPSLVNCDARFDVMLVVPWRVPVHFVNAFY